MSVYIYFFVINFAISELVDKLLVSAISIANSSPCSSVLESRSHLVLMMIRACDDHSQNQKPMGRPFVFSLQIYFGN